MQPVFVSTLDLQAAARLILTPPFTKVCALQDAVREPHNDKAVHDMRVACRRMKSAFRLLRAYLPQKRVKALEPFIEKLRDTLGEIRNLDVLRADVANYRAGITSQADDALDQFDQVLSATRTQALEALVNVLDSAAYDEWVQHTRAFLQTDTGAATLRVADVLPALLWQQYGAVRKYETHVRDAPLPALHALRIEVKRLRYTLEFFYAPLCAPHNADAALDTLLETLIVLQDGLGTLQDAVVGENAVTAFLSSQLEKYPAPFQAVPALLAYHATLHTRIETRRTTLPHSYSPVVSLDFREKLAALTARL